VVGLFRTSEPSRYGPSGPGSTALWARDQSADDIGQRLRGVLSLRLVGHAARTARLRAAVS